MNDKKERSTPDELEENGMEEVEGLRENGAGQAKLETLKQELRGCTDAGCRKPGWLAEIPG